MRRAFRLIGRRKVQREVDDELAFHLAMRAEQLERAGMAPESARREAMRQFGDLAGVRDDCVGLDRERERAQGRTDLLGALRQDFAYALRTLRRNAGFSAVVVLTLAIGIGANTTIFTLVNALLLRTLPVPDPGSLVALGDPSRTGALGSGDPRADIYSYPLYRDVVGHPGPLTDVLASGRADRMDVRIDSGTGGSGYEHPRGRFVSANYFRVLGLAAGRGRVFDGTEDDVVGTEPFVVISDGWWTRRFQRDPGTVGRTIAINGVAVTVIGIAPPGFTGDVIGVDTDLWLPLGIQPLLMPHERRLDDRSVSWLLLLGRLRPGATVDQARAALDPFVRQAMVDHSEGTMTPGQARRSRVPIGSGALGFSGVRAAYGVPLLTLMVGVGLLMLIICANVSNLMLARAVARGREMSVRMAIGAGRGRLVRQLLTESATLAVLGAAAGLLLALWGSRLLLALVADGSRAIPLDTRLDIRVLGFTAAVSLATVLLAGLVPALRASRVDLASALNANARTVGALGVRGQRMPLGRLLIAGQVALSLVLLIGAGLFVRNLRALQQADTGLDRDHLLIVGIGALSRGYGGGRMAPMAQQLGERLAALPGVTHVTWSENGIFSGTESANTFLVPGFEPQTPDDSNAYYDQVGPGYFAAIGATLLRGREFTARDDTLSPRVIVINETLARFAFGTADPVGRTVRFDDTTSATVVGVVADVHDHELGVAPRRRYYMSYQQHPLGEPERMRIEVRTAGDPAALTASVRGAIAEVDPLLGVDGVDPLTLLMRRSIREERLVARLASAFGALALLLAAIGLYGVMTYAITRRTGEIGLRVALGASRGAVVRMVLGEALTVVALGVVAGVPLAFAATRLLRTQLRGVEAADPAALGVALAVLAASAAVAALLPALRAAAVGPMVALRQD